MPIDRKLRDELDWVNDAIVVESDGVTTFHFRNVTLTTFLFRKGIIPSENVSRFETTDGEKIVRTLVGEGFDLDFEAPDGSRLWEEFGQ